MSDALNNTETKNTGKLVRYQWKHIVQKASMMCVVMLGWTMMRILRAAGKNVTPTMAPLEVHTVTGTSIWDISDMICGRPAASRATTLKQLDGWVILAYEFSYIVSLHTSILMVFFQISTVCCLPFQEILLSNQ